MRPPLPDGPYLVVGLARSGTAAARMLREHGEVIAVDSGAPDVPDDIDAHLNVDGVDLLVGRRERTGAAHVRPALLAEASHAATSGLAASGSGPVRPHFTMARVAVITMIVAPKVVQ